MAQVSKCEAAGKRYRSFDGSNPWEPWACAHDHGHIRHRKGDILRIAKVLFWTSGAGDAVVC
jgi:hypothetical protein